MLVPTPVVKSGVKFNFYSSNLIWKGLKCYCYEKERKKFEILGCWCWYYLGRLIPDEAHRNFSIIKKIFYFWSKSKFIENLFYYIVSFSYLLFPISFLIVAKKNNSSVPKIIAIYGLVCFCFLFYYDMIPKNLKQSLQSAYTFFEYSVFTFIFWINYNSKKAKRIIIIISILFLSFQIFYLFTTKTKGLDSIPIGIETIIILFYIVYFFYQFSKDLSKAYIYNHSGFWISVGILIYLCGSFFFFILFSQLSREQKESFGVMTYVAEIIKNLLFVLAIFVQTHYPFEKAKRKEEPIPYLDMI